MSDSPAGSVRARVRAELTEEITSIARRHLVEHGAAGLSLRAVAREAGMVSSAVYRYFPSRDELLTALIVDAYNSVGAAVEEASARRRRGDFEGRWWAICAAVRGWAVDNPHEWALLYGSPVPGYAAPADTIGPAGLAPLAFLHAVADGVNAGTVASTPGPMPRSVRSDLARLRRETTVDVPDDVLARGLAAWAGLFGAISFELFGHLHNVITDQPAFFELQMRAAGAGLARAVPTPRDACP